jgi:DNA-binding transcriptional regulator YbjK
MASGKRTQRTQRTRDPEARKAALAGAALETIAEVGIGRTTHRAVAARAGLPLGATTYYFPTLDDLIAAALHQATEELRAELEAWSARLADAADLPAALAGLLADYVADRDETLRPLAEQWLTGVREALTPRIGTEAAWSLCTLADGAMLQALVTGAPLDAARLTTAFRRLIP